MPNYKDGSTVGVRGRPSLVTERREQIVNAFIELVADRGSTAVSLEEVARHAGVARTAIHHFVGNRIELLEHAVVELVARYRKMIDAAVGPEPHPEQLIAMLFDDGWVHNRPLEDRAFDLLVAEARDNPEIQALVGGAFTHLVETFSAALATCGATGTAKDLDNASYAIVCLSEHNVVMQALGFDPAHSQAAATYARGIVASILPDLPAPEAPK